MSQPALHEDHLLDEIIDTFRRIYREIGEQVGLIERPDANAVGNSERTWDFEAVEALQHWAIREIGIAFFSDDAKSVQKVAENDLLSHLVFVSVSAENFLLHNDASQCLKCLIEGGAGELWLGLAEKMERDGQSWENLGDCLGAAAKMQKSDLPAVQEAGEKLKELFKQYNGSERPLTERQLLRQKLWPSLKK